VDEEREDVMKKCYRPRGFDQKIGYLIEECGETMAALGKSIRWGFNSVNPELPVEKQEKNRTWVRRELRDLKRAIRLVEEVIEDVETLKG